MAGTVTDITVVEDFTPPLFEPIFAGDELPKHFAKRESHLNSHFPKLQLTYHLTSKTFAVLSCRCRFVAHSTPQHASLSSPLT